MIKRISTTKHTKSTRCKVLVSFVLFVVIEGMRSKCVS